MARLSRQANSPQRTERFVDHLTPLVLIAKNTGLRRGELFQLEWKDIDLVDKLITVTGFKAKSGQTRRLPLNQEAHEVLTSWQAQAKKPSVSHMFPGSGGSRLTTISTAWRSLKATAGLPEFQLWRQFCGVTVDCLGPIRATGD